VTEVIKAKHWNWNWEIPSACSMQTAHLCYIFLYVCCTV